MTLFMTSPVNAQETRIYIINPSTGDNNFIFYTNTTSVGTRFTLTVWVSNVTDLFAWQIGLNYSSPSVLNFTKAEYPSDHVFADRGFIAVEPTPTTVKLENRKGETVNLTNPVGSRWGPQGEFTLTKWQDVDVSGNLTRSDIVWLEETGQTAHPSRVRQVVLEDVWKLIVEYPYVTFGATLLLGQPTFSGTGKLAEFEFEIVGTPPKRGEVSISFGINNTDTYLWDSNLDDISTGKEGGLFRYIWSEPTTKPNLAVDPDRVEYGPSLPSAVRQEFDIQVLIKNLNANWNLTTVMFSLGFNQSLLEVVNWTVNPLWTTHSIDNVTSPGEILVYVASPSSTPSEDVLILSVKFRVIYQGLYPEVDTSDLTLGSKDSPIILKDHVSDIPTEPPVNGTVVINGLQVMPLEVRPNKYVTNKLDPFNVTVWLSDVTADKRLIGVQFRLKYNATLLKVLNVTEGSFLKDISDTLFISYNITREEDDPYYYSRYGSHIHVGIVMLATGGHYPDFPQGSNVTVTITFQGIHRGFYPPEENDCILELVDILLVDDEYNPVVTTPVNGYYKIWSYRSPVAAFTYAPSVLNAAVPVVFNASASHDFNMGFIVNYTWDFGDGNITTTSTPIINHTYTTPRPYNVTLKVTDDDGQTNNTTEPITVSKLTSTISITVAPSTITFSQNTTINGVIEPTRVAVNITIQYRLQDETEWQTLTTKTTDNEGKYSYTWTLTEVGTYELTASWSGDEITDPAQSDISTLIVNRAKSTITVSLNALTTTVGSEVTISGTLTPMRANVSVTVLSRLSGGTWLTLGTIRTDSSGGYTHTWTTTAAGTHEIRTTYLGDNNMGPAQSRIAALRINRATCTITINIDPTPATVGSNVTISGTITPTKPEVSVTIHHRRPGGTWKTLAEVKTDLTSSYAYTWEMTEIGDFEVKASFSGDADTLPGESEIKTIDAEPRPINILLYAISIYLIIIVAATGITIYYVRKPAHIAEATYK